MSKEKTKAELLEELKKLTEKNSELIKENNRLKNGGDELTYTFKFSINEASGQYLDELKQRTKFVSRRIIKNMGRNHENTLISEQREWPDGNRIVIFVPVPLNETCTERAYIGLIKGMIPRDFIRIDFYDVSK